MQRPIVTMLVVAISCVTTVRAAAPADHPAETWIARSNSYTNQFLDVQLEHSPEEGSQEGVAKFDERISNPTLADEMAERHELAAVLTRLDAARGKETDKKVWQDLDILRKAFELRFRQQDYSLQHEVPFYNASEEVFQGLRGLLDDQVVAERRQAALVRLRKYAGVEPGYAPFAELLRQREIEQIAKPEAIYPSKGELDTELGRNPNYIEGIAALFKKYKLAGWEPAYAKLKDQLTGYDAWVWDNILPKARTDFRLQPEKYALAFERYGIDIPPAKIASMAHAAFKEYQADMSRLAVRIAKANGYSSSDYRAVIAEL